MEKEGKVDLLYILVTSIFYLLLVSFISKVETKFKKKVLRGDIPLRALLSTATLV